MSLTPFPMLDSNVVGGFWVTVECEKPPCFDGEVNFYSSMVLFPLEDSPVLFLLKEPPRAPDAEANEAV